MAGLVPAIHGLRLEKVMATGRRHPRRSRASTVQLKQAKQVRHDDHNGVTTGTTGSEPRRRSRRVLCGFVVSFVMNLPAVRPGSGFAGMNTFPKGAPTLPTHTLSFRPIPVIPAIPYPRRRCRKTGGAPLRPLLTQARACMAGQGTTGRSEGRWKRGGGPSARMIGKERRSGSVGMIGFRDFRVTGSFGRRAPEPSQPLTFCYDLSLALPPPAR